jgi:hypothetical protein
VEKAVNHVDSNRPLELSKEQTTLSADADVRASRKSRSDADPKFEEAWRLHPKREGGSSKKAALKAWNARIREGVDAQVLLNAVKAYASAMLAAGNIGTRYIKQASTFFGPDRHYEEFAKSPDSRGDLFDAAGDALPWWTKAGFRYQWEATNAGCSERSAHLWQNGTRAEVCE